MKLSWLLVFKIFIVLFWFLGMVGFIAAAIDNHRTFLELLAHWNIALMFVVILFGCISIILDFIFKEKNIMVSYFIIFFFYIILQSSFTLFTEYFSFLKYGYRWTHLYELIISGQTEYIALWLMFIGVYLCGFVSYFQKITKGQNYALHFALSIIFHLHL